MSGTNCTDGQILYTLQIYLQKDNRYWRPDEYISEIFLWKVQAVDESRTILYGSENYYRYKDPVRETFCLDTESCYDITIQKGYSYHGSGFRLYAGDELRSQEGNRWRDYYRYGNIDHFENTCILPTSPPTGQYYSSYYEDQNNFFDDNRDIFVAALFIFFLLTCSIRRNRARRENLNQRIANAQQLNNNDDNNLTEAEQHDRRLKILKSIITKKVLPKQDSSLEKSHSLRTSMIQDTRSSSNFKMSNDGDVTNDDSDPNADQNHSTTNDHYSVDEEEEIVVVPMSKSQLQRDEKIIDSCNSDSSQGKLKKGDIYAQSLRSLQNAMNIKSTSTSSLLSPKSCPICMEPYEAGDEIAWSKNESCLHSFHPECIVGWLMTNDDCPMCRQDYLCDNSTEV